MNFLDLWLDDKAQTTKSGLETQNVVVVLNVHGLTIFYLMFNIHQD